VIADTLATIDFFTTITAMTELFVAGMEPQEVLMTRLVMVTMMLLTGRTYGLWRDWFFRTTRPTVSWSKTLIDGIAFLTFQLPIYAITLVIVGADTGEIFTLLGSTAILMLIVSRPCGLFLEILRRLAGVSSQQSQIPKASGQPLRHRT
jgi:hypothetical protein